MRRLRPLLIGAAAAAALAGTFALYLAPEVVVSLANRVWACF